MPTDFFGRVMVVFNRYGIVDAPGRRRKLKIAVGTLVGCIIGFAVGIVRPYQVSGGTTRLKGPCSGL